MVTADVQQSAMGVIDAFETRDVMGVAAIGALTVGGLFIAQEATDQVLPMLGMSADPSNGRELGAAILFKLLLGGVMVAAATRTGMTGQAVIGMLTLGVVGSAGLDAVDMAQRSGLPGTSPSKSTSSKSRSTSRGRKRRSRSPSASRSNGTVRRAASAGGSSKSFR